MLEMLENFRKQYPAYSEMSDATLSNNIYNTFYSDHMTRQEFNTKLDYKGLSQGSDGVTFLESIQAGMKNLGSAATALQAGFSSGDSRETYLNAYKENQQKTAKLLEGATDWRDILDADSIGEGFGRTLDFIKEQFGLNSPQMAAIMAGGAGMSAAAPWLPHPLATGVSKVGGFAVGSSMVMMPMFTGFNVGRQIDEGKPINLPVAGAWAIPQTIMEAALLKVFTTTGLTSIGQSVLGKTSSKTVERIGQKVGEALAVGIPSEVLQQSMERAAADLDVLSDEALEEYLDAAIAAAAALSPMGAIATLPSVSKDTSGGLSKEQIEDIVKEDIQSAPEPASNMIKTPEEASQALQSVGWTPESIKRSFTPEGSIKAANIMIDRADKGRMDFLKSFAPEGTPLEMFVNQQKPLENSPSVLSEDYILKAPISDLSSKITSVTSVGETPISSKLLSGASTDVLKEQGRVANQTYDKAIRNQYLPQEYAIEDLDSQIISDITPVEKKLGDLERLSNERIIEIAKEDYGITEDKLKEPTGKFKPKKDLIESIGKDILEKKPQFKPKATQVSEVAPVENSPKISPKSLEELPSLVQPLRESSEVVAKMKLITNNLKRITKGIDPEGDLKVNTETRAFEKPVKAAQASNYIYTSINFRNVASYPNLDLNLREAWEYYYDSLGNSQQVALERNFDTLKENFEQSYYDGDFNSSIWLDGEDGHRELISHAFAKFAQEVREGRPQEIPLPKDTKRVFTALINNLENSEKALKGLNYRTFEEVFSDVSETGVTPRDAVFESIQKLREIRLNNLAKEIQRKTHDYYDKELIEDKFDKAFKEHVEDSKKRFAQGPISKAWLAHKYNTLLASAKHFAEQNPLFGQVFGYTKKMNEAQDEMLTQIREAGMDFFSEKSKPVRDKAASVIDHLNVTGQRLRRDHQGNLTFERDGQMVVIKNPRMISTIEGLQNMFDTTWEIFDKELRHQIDKYIEGSLTKTPSDIEASLDQMIQDGVLNGNQERVVRNLLEDLRTVVQSKGKPYIPQSRFGEYGFTVHLKSNLDSDGNVKKGTKAVYHSQVESGLYKKRFEKESYQKTQKDLEKYRNNPDYVIYEGYEMSHNNIFSKLSKDDVTLEMLAGLIGTDQGYEYYRETKDYIDSKAQHKGFSLRLNPQQNIPGFSTDYDRVISNYVTSSAHFFAKARYQPLIQDAANEIYGGDHSNPTKGFLGDKHRDTKKAIANYIKYTEDPFDSWQTIRQINFGWTMGLNVSTGLLQFMTLPTSSLSSMTRYNGDPLSNGKILMDHMKIAFKEFSKNEFSRFEEGVYIFELDNPEFLKVLKNKYKWSDAKIKFMVESYRKGHFGATSLEEQAGTRNYSTEGLKGKIKEGSRVTTNVMGIFVSGAEQATRFATLMGHYDMFANNPEAVKTGLRILEEDGRFQGRRTMSKDSVIDDLSVHGMEDSHAIFGKVGRSALMRGWSGAFAFPFMTYPQQITEFMFSLYGKGPEGKRAFATMATSLFIFSGMMGLPGGELAKELLEELYKFAAKEEIDLDYMIREKLTEATGDPRFGMFATQGIGRALFNADVSRRIGLPIVGQDLLLALMGVRGDMSDLMGVQGSMLTQAIEGWRAYGADESHLKVAAHLTPMAISNVLKAMNYAEDGVRTTKGTQLVSKEEIQSNPIEIFARALGVGTGRVASAREEQYWKQLENTRIRPKMDSFRARGKNYATKMYQAVKEGNSKDATKWRKKYQELIEDVKDYLNRKQWPYDMGAFHRSVFNAVDQRAFAGVRLEDLNKAIRHRKPVLEEVSGKGLYK